MATMARSRTFVDTNVLVHDANIVATMLAHDIGAILTHNAADYNRFAGLISVLSLTAHE